MNKEIRVVDEKKGVVQITTMDERWYAEPGQDSTTGLPTYIYKPSVTWIADYYPKGYGFYKWLASNGWDEAEAIKKAAGDSGTKVHIVTEMLENGADVPLDIEVSNRDGIDETLTAQELTAILSFKKAFEELQPEVIATELTVFGDTYAGTIDSIWRINGQIWVIDKKTSKDVWESHKLQISAYSHANIPYSNLGITKEEWASRKLGILQLGYNRNKKGWKFTEIEDKIEMFRIAEKVWLNENPKAAPKQIELPLIISIDKKKKEI